VARRQTRQTVGQRLQAATAPALPSIRAVYDCGEITKAVNQIQHHYNATPSPEAAELYRTILAAFLDQLVLADNGKEFDRFFPLSEKLKTAAPNWPVTQATLLAKMGRLPQALMAMPATATEADRAKLVGHAADHALRARSYAGLPDEHHGDMRAMTLAISKYHRGDDEGAREQLQSIGLQSPFLDWKLLLRGLMAHAAADDAKALENWSRLDALRMPAKLARPLRASLDTAFRESLPTAERSAAARIATALQASASMQHLEQLRGQLGRGRSMASAWRAAENAWASLKTTNPDLAKRLGEVMYFEIQINGQPADTAHHRRIFGAPADDPDYYRMHATVLEMIGSNGESIEYWEKYERWLAKNPTGWPPQMVRRARAKINIRMGDLASAGGGTMDAMPKDFIKAMESLLGKMPKNLKPPKPKQGKTPAYYYAQAALHHPDSNEVLLRQMRLHMENGDGDAALAAGLQVLDRDPVNVEASTSLPGFLYENGRFREYFDLQRRIAAANPLKESLQRSAAAGWMAIVRKLMFEGSFVAGRALFDEHLAEYSRVDALIMKTLQATLAIADGDAAAEAEVMARIAATPNARASAAFAMTIDAELVKIKPARKAILKKALAATLAGPLTAGEVTSLGTTFRGLQSLNLPIRGLKTFFAKVRKLVQALPLQAMTQEDAERLLLMLALNNEWKLLQQTAYRINAYHPNRAFIKFCILFAGANLGQRNLPRFGLKDFDAELTARTDEIGEFYRMAKPTVEELFDEFDIFEDDGFEDPFEDFFGGGSHGRR
jgi:hypothetical protein